MHELSICQNIVTQVTDIAAQHNASGIALIRLQIGPLSGVETALLEHAFPMATAGSVAEDATLEIEAMPIRVQCKRCQTLSDASASCLICRQCGERQTTLVSGDEMLLASVELVKA